MNTRNTRRGFTQIQRVGQADPALQPCEAGSDNAPAKERFAATYCPAELVLTATPLTTTHPKEQIPGPCSPLRGAASGNAAGREGNVNEALNKGSFRALFRSGFTLIELLVVILIIGILAAVAIPQYQKAVGVSHIKALFPIARSVLDSELRFYLGNGYFTGNLNRLDITPTQGCYENGYRCFYGKITVQGNMTDSPTNGLIVSEDGFPPLYIWLSSLAANEFCCLASDSSDNKYHKMCKQAMQPLSRTIPITGATYYCMKIP